MLDLIISWCRMLRQCPGAAGSALSFALRAFCQHVVLAKEKTYGARISEFKKVLSQTLIDPVPEPRLFWFRYLYGAKKTLVPSQDFFEYIKKVSVFSSTRDPLSHRVQILPPGQNGNFDENWLPKITGPSKDLREAFQVRYHNFEYAEAAVKGPRSVYFITWHHGAASAVNLLMLERFPGLNFFSWEEQRYKTWRSISLNGDPKIGLLKIAKSFEEKRPVLLSFDASFGKRDLKYRFFGMQFYFPRGILHCIRQYAPAVLPVTAYLRGTTEIDIYAGDTLFSPSEVKTMTDGRILDRIMNYFIQDLKKQGPEQIGRFDSWPRMLKPSSG